MTAPVIQMTPEGHYSRIDLSKFLFELEAFYKQKEVMHTKEAAAFLGISIRQLNNLCAAGSVKYHRLEGLTGKLFLRSEIVEQIRRS